MKKAKDTKGQVRQAKRSASAESASYASWIAELKRRYRVTQIKAAVAVNSALIEFYWNFGKDICEKYPGKKRDAKFFNVLSMDLQREIPGVSGLSVSNIKYARYFFELYSAIPYRPHPVDDKSGQILSELVGQLVCVPWGHHRTIIDKCKGDRDKALFYVRRTIQNGWSRNSLLNWLSSDLYESEGKAQTNFELKRILPTQAQLVKCYADAERQIAEKVAAKSGGKCLYATVYIKENGLDVKGQLDKLFGE